MTQQTRNLLALVAAAIGATMAAAACGGGGGAASDSGPKIGAMSDVTVSQDTTAMVAIPVFAGQESVSALKIAAGSVDQTLVAPEGITLQSSGGTTTLNLTPAEDATGTTLINVAVQDSQGRAAAQSFKLTVNPVYLSFTAYADGILAKTEADAPAQVSGFTFVQDADDPATFSSVVQ